MWFACLSPKEKKPCLLKKMKKKGLVFGKKKCFTVGSKIIRALEIVRVKKLIPNAVL